MRKPWEQFGTEYVVSLFPVFMLSAGFWTGGKSLTGYPIKISLVIKGNSVLWIYDPKNWKLVHSKLVEKVKSNPKIVRDACKKMVRLGEAQIRMLKGDQDKFLKASNSSLVNFYAKFIRSNSQVYDAALILPLLDYQGITFLSDELHKILKGKKAEKYFSLLTTSTQQTYVKRQEVDLLRLAQIKDEKLLRRKLKEHTKKYNWVYYVYEGPAVDEQYFKDALNDLRSRKVSAKKALAILKNEGKEISKKQTEIYTKYKFSDYERQIAEFARDSAFYKPFRRELQSHAYYLAEKLLREIGRRLNLSIKQVRMMLPSEIKVALKTGHVDLNEIENRQQSLFYYFNGGKEICLSGKKAEAYIARNVYLEKFDLKATSFRGTTAFPGKVRAKVKIINKPDEIRKMNRGEILVAVTTSPNLMPAIRLAKAIVTEEGGLTCHAAIVARELHIPTVVGVKSVAHALKDGDMVEVDATKGLVRKI